MSGTFSVAPPMKPSKSEPLDDIELSSLPAVLYGLNRHRVGNTRMTRTFGNLLLIVALIWAPGWLPGGWWVSVLCLAVILVVSLRVRMLRARDFVTFTPELLPDRPAQQLSPQEKVPLYATGWFEVEGKTQRFTSLPGFYRRFATGERAILCVARSRSFWRVGHWPEDEVGMWYIFFRPDMVRAARFGKLHFGPTPLLTVAVDYEATIPASGRFKSERLSVETVYLACPTEECAGRVLADLQADIPVVASGSVTQP